MKKRIHQISAETGISNQELIEAAVELGFSVTSHSSSVTKSEEEEILSLFERPKLRKAPRKGRTQKVKSLPAPQTSKVKEFTEKYEKKTVKKEKPPKVKEVSQTKANRLFTFGLALFTLIILGMGGLSIATSLRVNTLIKETNTAIKQLNQENLDQNKVINQLEESQKWQK